MPERCWVIGLEYAQALAARGADVRGRSPNLTAGLTALILGNVSHFRGALRRSREGGIPLVASAVVGAR
jgi:hypothetical protein